MSNGWTEERRKRQAELIHSWQPWQHSTGPRTPEGKEASKRNATKHGARGELTRHINWLLKQYDESLEQTLMDVSHSLK